MVNDSSPQRCSELSAQPPSGASRRPGTAEMPEYIDRLIRSEPFAVLCTQGDGQPYGSVVALAPDPDLRSLVFATSVDTHKYRLLTQCTRVAIVIDSRPSRADDILQGEALTVTGVAEQVERGVEHDRLSGLLASRHPRLTQFVAEPGTALFRVWIGACTSVNRFQSVIHWSSTPGTTP